MAALAPASPRAPGAAGTSAAPPAPRPPQPPPLVGHVTRADLIGYAPWRTLFTEVYTPAAADVATIKANAQGVTVLMIMATWCPDSKRELPRYFAIMDAAGVPDSTLTMIGVDRSKKDADGLTETWGVTRVPTFVFLRGDREIGRFVERTSAGSTLEAEIARAISGGQD